MSFIIIKNFSRWFLHFHMKLSFAIIFLVIPFLISVGNATTNCQVCELVVTQVNYFLGLGMNTSQIEQTLNQNCPVYNEYEEVVKIQTWLKFKYLVLHCGQTSFDSRSRSRKKWNLISDMCGSGQLLWRFYYTDQTKRRELGK